MPRHTEPLRSAVIVRPHAQHHRDCGGTCGVTIGCKQCKRRKGVCLREPGQMRLCARCAAKRAKAGS